MHEFGFFDTVEVIGSIPVAPTSASSLYQLLIDLSVVLDPLTSRLPDRGRH